MKYLLIALLLIITGCAEKEKPLPDIAECLGQSIANKPCDKEVIDIKRIEIIITTD